MGMLGPSGGKGPAGDSGLTGENGDPGEPGANGPSGIDGLPGVNGPLGPKGEMVIDDFMRNSSVLIRQCLVNVHFGQATTLVCLLNDLTLSLPRKV